MCGIAGIIARGEKPALEQAAVNIMNAMSHRGPDGQGMRSFSLGEYSGWLVNTRLSILDLSKAGSQPMSSDDDLVWLVHNGEIYNHLDLRKDLEQTDRRWRGRADTETLLRAYLAWGPRCVERLRGMFAFVVLDCREGNALFLARDSFGIKPLYYYYTSDMVVFASEMRGLLASGLVPRRLNPAAIESYLRYGCIEAPGTIIDGVLSLLPGETMTAAWDTLGVRVHRSFYHSSVADPSEVEVEGYKAARAKVRELLEDSVKAHLISDVPLGAFLSGGIDSSVIAALMSRVAKERPKTFTVTFKERAYSEANYARQVAARLGTDHYEIPLGQNDLLEMLPRALEAMDQPTIDGVNTYVVSKAVKEQGVTVALSGLGGDELFGGYPSFSRVRWAPYISSLPDWVRGKASPILGPLLGRVRGGSKLLETLASPGSAWDVYRISRRLFSDDDIFRLLSNSLVHDTSSPPLWLDGRYKDSFHALSRFEMGHYMANMLLRDTDFMSMAHSLEVRVPFVDVKVAPYILGLDQSLKRNGHISKSLLVAAVRDLLPEEVWRRPKTGFILPFSLWLRGALRDEVDNILAAQDALRRIGLAPGEAQRVWREFLARLNRVGWTKPWALYVLSKWAELNKVTL